MAYPPKTIRLISSKLGYINKHFSTLGDEKVDKLLKKL
jgi:hypothetical protein